MRLNRQFQSMFLAWQRAAKAHDSDGQALAVLGDPAYTRQFRMPKWNGTVSMLRNPDVAIRHRSELQLTPFKGAHRQRAEHFTHLASDLQQEAYSLIRDAEEKYGAQGPLISGGLREHWPLSTKDVIRFASQGSQILRDAARLHDSLTKTRSPAFKW